MELTNTFTFAEEGIGIQLDEATIGDDNKAVDHDNDRFVAGEEYAEDDTEKKNPLPGQDYVNIIPGMEMDKDPTVTIAANSLNCNVFVSVENQNDKENDADEVLTIKDFNTTAWEEVLPSEFDLVAANGYTKYYVYKGSYATTEKVEAGDEYLVVPTDTVNPTVLEDVFKTLKVSTSLNPERDKEGKIINPFFDIVIKAAAVQADSCSDYDAGKTALEMLGCTEK